MFLSYLLAANLVIYLFLFIVHTFRIIYVLFHFSVFKSFDCILIFLISLVLK